jgi:hypothetical protein
MRVTIKSFWPAVVWMILATTAFFIPGESLPKENWLDKIYADKWVHVGIFAVGVVVWSLPMIGRTIQRPLKRLFYKVAIIFFGYGVLIEVLQHFFSSNRSFDWSDIGADAVGCLMGYLYLTNQWKT